MTIYKKTQRIIRMKASSTKVRVRVLETLLAVIAALILLEDVNPLIMKDIFRKISGERCDDKTLGWICPRENVHPGVLLPSQKNEIS